MSGLEIKIKREVAAALHDALAQHLVGSLLVAQVHLNSLKKNGYPEVQDAEKLLSLLQQASGDLQKLITDLDQAPR